MKRLIPFLLLLVTSTAFAATGLNKMKKLIALLVLNVLLISSTAFAATYYAAASGGGGAASCVDSGANVCTLARAVVVASTGTNTIQCAAGTYAITTELTLDSGNTGANLTFTCATANGCTWGSSGTSTVVDIETTMVSGTVTFDDINIDDGGADYSIRNQSPEVNVVYKNGTINNTDATVGIAFYYPVDTTNRIVLATGEDSWTNIKTGATTNVKIAQKIVIGASDIVVNLASFKLQRKCGNLSNNCDQYVSGESWDYRTGDTMTVTIETDNAGAPSGTPVTNGTSETKLAFNIPFDSDEWETFTFASNVTLTSSTTYWVVLTPSYSASASNYITASTDTGNGYASGDCALFDATNWTGCSAGTDLLFTINRNHTRDLTVQDSTITTRSSGTSIGWSDNVTFQRNSSSSTAGNGLGLSTTNMQTTVGNQLNKVLVEGNVFNIPTSASYAVSIAVSGATFTQTYINSYIFKDNTGEASQISAPASFIKKIYITGNDMDLTYNGNTPLKFGTEVDGVDPQGILENPFEQIVIENNTFRYTSSTHNHLMLIAPGVDSGVLRNNTIIATNSGGAAAWGIILKGNNWLIDHNNFYGPSPAVYMAGASHSRVTNNTMYCFTNGNDGCIYIHEHQDNIYGGRNGIPFYNYVKDNISYQEDSTTALEQSSISVEPIRNPLLWSNVIDNNVYYASTNTNQIEITTGASTENVTSAEGLAVLQATWQSDTYTDATSLSKYNDLNSVMGDPGLIDPANGIFTATSGSVKGQGSVDNTNIGSVQSNGGRKWIGRGVS